MLENVDVVDVNIDKYNLDLGCDGNFTCFSLFREGELPLSEG